MAVLTRRDRIAVAMLMALIVAGWGIRFARDRSSGDKFTVYHGALPVPGEIAASPDGSDLLAPLDLNTATVEELTVLPMIGQARAAAIVSYRREHGPFDRPDDIIAVPGIGPGILARIRPDIVTAPSTDGRTASDSTAFDEK